MTLSFPANPSNGQVYGDYIFSTTRNAWERRSLIDDIRDDVYSFSDNITALENKFPVSLSNGGTSAVTVQDARKNLGIGLVPIVPPTVNYSGGSATANSSGVITFINVTSVSLNNAFPTTYKNFRIICSGNLRASVSGTPFNLRLRSSGVDASGTNYYGQGVVQQGTSVPAASHWTGGSSYHALTNLYTDGYGYSVVDITSPNEPYRTLLLDSNGGYSGTAGFYVQHFGLHDVLTAYDGFTLLSGTAATISGTVQVFGYNS